MEDKKNRFYKTFMLVILTAFLTFTITAFWISSRFYEKLSTETEGESNSSDLISSLASDKYSKLENYLEKIRSVIDKYYLWSDEIDEEKLETAAIQGFVAGLGDEYSQYIPKEKLQEYEEEVRGNFVGIGINMIKDKNSNRIAIYYPIPDSPAEKAGIKAGDLIIEVDGKEYFADDFENISDYIKGEEGTDLHLVVERNGERLSFDLKRAKIMTNPITAKKLENDIGCITIPSFDEETADAFKSKVEALQNEGVKKLIIDLRNNGGGIVDEATKIADFLLDKGDTIISTVDHKDEKEVTKSENEPIFTMPVVVLVNENSASSSEILACSLQDNGRAKVVGTKTYGKGIIQTVLSLSDGSGLQLTTEEYYTPNGNTIHKTGVKPDEEIELPDTVESIYALEESEDTQLQKAIEILK